MSNLQPSHDDAHLIDPHITTQTVSEGVILLLHTWEQPTSERAPSTLPFSQSDC